MNIVDVGYGYRDVTGEPWKEGDEHFHVSGWFPCCGDDNTCQLQRRRKIEVPEGFRLIGVDETAPADLLAFNRVTQSWIPMNNTHGANVKEVIRLHSNTLAVAGVNVVSSQFNHEPKSDHGWILCSERQPDKTGRYDVQLENGERMDCFYSCNSGKWGIFYTDVKVKELRWFSIPPPPPIVELSEAEKCYNAYASVHHHFSGSVSLAIEIIEHTLNWKASQPFDKQEAE